MSIYGLQDPEYAMGFLTLIQRGPSEETSEQETRDLSLCERCLSCFASIFSSENSPTLQQETPSHTPPPPTVDIKDSPIRNRRASPLTTRASPLPGSSSYPDFTPTFFIPPTQNYYMGPHRMFEA